MWTPNFEKSPHEVWAVEPRSFFEGSLSDQQYLLCALGSNIVPPSGHSNPKGFRASGLVFGVGA